MAGRSKKLPTNNRWPRGALISNSVPVAEVDPHYKYLEKTNFVINLIFYKIFKNKDSPPKDKVQAIIEKIIVEYLTYLEEQTENEVLYSSPGEIVTI